VNLEEKMNAGTVKSSVRSRGHTTLPLEYHKTVQRGIPASLALFGLLVIPATLVSTSAAQRAGAHAGSHLGSSGHPTNAQIGSQIGLQIHSLASSRNAYSGRFRQPFGYAALPFPFLDGSFTLDDLYSSGYPVASAPPPEFLLQAARSLPVSQNYASQRENTRGPSSTEPLMIELQNGQYVRVSTTAIDGEARELTTASAAAYPDSAPAHNRSLLSTPNPQPSQPRDLPPAVLVFRDGHSEEVRDYTIADGILYARGDYYVDGYWSKKIEVSALNVPETLQANETRGAKFVLPSAPNEVVTRP
jgi:hypothetical protein